MLASMHVCVNECMHGPMHACTYDCMYCMVLRSACVHVCVYASRYISNPAYVLVRKTFTSDVLGLLTVRWRSSFRFSALVYMRPIWEFGKMRGTLFWGPYNKDPTI